ncbi:MAG: hypothetical protein EDM03_07335 [Porphyrobacter sp. IPPAS B-1204]|nr:MAG: hypothetical protein EDM03_07335 [Porphyrobacter sp. IPPAS B-1204]
MIDEGLRAALAAFDDAALATLANPGLVRRAHRDVEEGKVRLVSASPGSAEIEADGHLVVLDARGAKAAPCACKSVAVCRHRLAAVVFVRDGAAGAAEASLDETPADPASILADFDPDRLAKWAGKAGWRAALELAPTASAVEPSANAIAVTFPDVEGPVLILRGQGFDGIVSKASKARAKAYHAAAVLAARAHFGEGLPLAEAEVEVEDAGPAPVDPAFLARIAGALEEVAMLGMNLAPLPLEESLFELSVSSRADALPRLASILRAIAAQMRLRRGRALDFDPDRMLELAATAFALVRALERGEPERRGALAGKVWRAYSGSEPLELVGCGAERWSTPAGARGVTAWFYEKTSDQWLSTSLARGPGQDPGFSPREAWQHQPYWSAESLAALSHAAFTLTGANRSADNRLSAPAAAVAAIGARKVAPDPAWPGLVRHWPDLRERWLAQVGLGIDTGEQAAVALIAPSAIAPAFFDDLAQQLVWPVRDIAGQWLALTLDHEEPVSTAIEALEANVRTGWQGMVLVRIERQGERLAARPITLFGAEEPVDLTLWKRPWWPSAKDGGAMRGWLDRLRQVGARRFEVQPRSTTDAALAKAWRHVIDLAEIGRSLARTLDHQRAAHAERLERLGMVRLADLLRAADDNAGLLAAAYGLMLARQQRCGPTLLA